MTIRIDRLDQAEVAAPAEDAGLGCLRTQRGNLPLDELDVQATITGLATQIRLTQGFQNPHLEPLEATYIFPLPPRAAVTSMRMEADGRVIEAVLKEREQARADYDQAITDGRRASIAEEERPGVFTMRVGNIMPGERVVVHLELAGSLPYEDDSATFRFPLVVGPRYIPGVPLPGDQVGDGTELDTTAVPDASRITPPVLLPGFPNPLRLSLAVHVDPAGLPVTGMASSLHVTATEDTGSGVKIRLNPGERADRDFVLRLRIGTEDAVATSLVVLPDEAGGTFALTVLPPSARAASVRPRDVVLLLDRSGSMGGWKLVAARRAAARIVDTLTPADRLAVLAFDHEVQTLTGLMEANDRNRFRAVEFLSGLEARGGTEMLAALRAAVELLDRADEDRDLVMVLVTDGQIGNEDQILRELAPRLAGVRVHTIGIDRLVNEGFLQRLAGLAGGRCELVESEDRLDEAMQAIHRRIATPIVTGLRLDPAGLAVDPATITPTPLPALFAGAAVVISGRFTGSPTGAVTLAGADGWQATVAAAPSHNASLAVVWARARIRDLEDRYVIGGSDGVSLEREIVDTSLRYRVLSRFTAFVAVDERVVNEGGTLHRMTQPVESPSGWQSPTPQAIELMAMATDAMPDNISEGWGGRAGLAECAAVFPSQQGFAPEPIKPQLLPTSIDAELRLLREASNQDLWKRATLLTALAARMRKLAGAQTGEFATILTKLADELEVPTADPTEIERRWQRAISTLESLTAPPRPPRLRRTFWKR
jgi:Ca-activated chloride channel family protein